MVKLDFASVADFYVTFYFNIESITRLLGSIRALQRPEEIDSGVFAPRPEPTDLDGDFARAAVVLTHASLECFVRDIAKQGYHSAEPGPLRDRLLDKIPFVGEESSSTKYALARVAKHAGKSVDQLVADSINEYFASRTYNSTSELDGALKELGIDTAGLKQWYPDVQAMMKRRHRVVHEADRPPHQLIPSGAYTRTRPKISDEELLRIAAWVRAATGIASGVVTAVMKGTSGQLQEKRDFVFVFKSRILPVLPSTATRWEEDINAQLSDISAE